LDVGPEPEAKLSKKELRELERLRALTLDDDGM